MVGLVVVSHSRALAAGVAELVAGVNEAAIPLAYAGGAGDDHGDLGTDATDIMEAIQQVASPDGVVVLMDLGSAILSAETALEFLEGMIDGEVRLVAAPLVEGAVSAAVQIGLGADLDAVIAEAMDALAPKRGQLGEAEAGAATDGAPADRPTQQAGAAADGALEREFPVETIHGLHARPAAALARTVGRFSADAWIRRGGAESSDWVNARSLNRIATLQIRCGDRFVLRAAGDDAGEMVAAVEALVDDNFGEPRGTQAAMQETAATGGATIRAEGTAPPPASSATGASADGVVRGIAASPGIAVGPAAEVGQPEVRYDTARITGREAPLADAEVGTRMDGWRRARESVAAELRVDAEDARSRGQHDAAEIAAAHETLLMDPELEDATAAILRKRDCEVPQAFWIAATELADTYRTVEDPYLRARAADVEDVARRLLRRLDPDAVSDGSMPTDPSILVAEDLLPSQTMSMDPAAVRAIVTTGGSATSHAAIIARGLGIPMVAAATLPADVGGLGGLTLVVDGDAGTVEIDPDADRVQAVEALRAEREARAREDRAAAAEPGHLSDGTSLPVRANVATAIDARAGADNGADGVGLLRTEFIFLGRREMPTEDEQVSALEEMLDPFGEHPVTVRILDIGGDKEVPYLDLPREANPFLGQRGVRLLLADGNRALLHTHLRAVLRAAAGHTVKVMIPMVTGAGEVAEVRRRLEAAHEELAGENVPHPWPLPVGSMIETPAAAIRAADLARVCDFFSVGTNDLTQYVMAAERGNAAVADLSAGRPAAVLEAIRQTVAGAATRGIPVGVCGEMGADPEAIPLLVGLGVDSLSVNPAAVAGTKALVRGLSLEECRRRLAAVER